MSVKQSVTNFCTLNLNFEKQIVHITFGDGAGPLQASNSPFSARTLDDVVLDDVAAKNSGEDGLVGSVVPTKS